MRVAVRDLNGHARLIYWDRSWPRPSNVVNDPSVDVVVEVIGASSRREHSSSKPSPPANLVTANKAVIARHGQEIAEAAAQAGVYVLIEAAVEVASRSSNLSSNPLGESINRVSGIINGTTNYILTRMADEGAAYDAVLRDAQELGTRRPIPPLMWMGLMPQTRSLFSPPSRLEVRWSEVLSPPKESVITGVDVDYARRLLQRSFAVAERMADDGEPLRATDPGPDGSSAGRVHGVNNAILVEGDPIGRVMFYGPGAGAGPTASAVVADILNIAEPPGNIRPSEVTRWPQEPGDAVPW